MNRTRSAFGDPGRIAPSVEKEWRDDFIVELRLLSAPGHQIGDELMTVETHVAESGEPAAQAFGEAKPYAREIAEATGATGRGGSIGPATIAGNGLGLLGMFATVHAVTHWLEGGPAGVTTGELVGLGVILLLVSTLLFTRTLRVIVEHPRLALLLPALFIGVFVGIFALLSDPLFTVPTVPLGVAGALLLLAGIAVNWLDLRVDASEIIAPGEVPSGQRRGRLLAALAMPLMTVLLLTQVWVMHALTS
ncbi:hypothetical protein [Janibacter cremeus]|uniref:Uncharacterized protein n=1 Tax=Janibacter cremeus TaxID=1285192 RepID=A0A852VR52_9MICO|nr:hypothetical protein [Janibacter cremeus]NYF98419.1 hypothetical protein [Janibacter cremeus]